MTLPNPREMIERAFPEGEPQRIPVEWDGEVLQDEPFTDAELAAAQRIVPAARYEGPELQFSFLAFCWETLLLFFGFGRKDNGHDE
ncbi:MAG TPA: hypothetical protein VFU47_07075 [Armatimonadota bacterium]|nr:hypothetical protein [Armatimonadota bacterium]